jgi:FkbM family methyltransferase
VGYRPEAIDVSSGDFQSPNAADILFARLGQQQQVPFVCLRRPRRWLVEMEQFRPGSIYARALHHRSRRASEATVLARRQGRWVFPKRRRQVGGRTAADLGSQPVRVTVVGPTRKASLLLPPQDHITVAIQQSGTYYESDLLMAIRARAPRGTFVDVGAHYGNHTAFFALECAAGHVIAIEPNPVAFAGLRANLDENGIERVVTPLQLAIHPNWKRVAVSAMPWRPRRGSAARTNTGMSRVVPVHGGGDAGAARLDDVLAEHRRIGLIKVDAEGLGAEVLSSSVVTLSRDRPLIAVETATLAAFAQVAAVLEPLGYQPTRRYCWTPTWLWTPSGHAATQAACRDGQRAL